MIPFHESQYGMSVRFLINPIVKHTMNAKLSRQMAMVKYL